MSHYTEIVGVYHADGTLLGELRYVWGKLRGTAHCSLCDITHAGIRQKEAFRSFMDSSGVPLRMVHLNERDEAQRAASDGNTPCVLGLGPSGWEILLTSEQLRACQKSVDAFRVALKPFLTKQGS